MSNRFELANAIRALSMDAVQKAKSGHPGAPMGMADIAEVLWRDFLKHNPANPKFADRDRFVLSNGHGSMLIYSLLHLTGYDANCTVKHRGIRNMAIRLALKPLPARWVRGWRTRWVWLLQRRCLLRSSTAMVTK